LAQRAIRDLARESRVADGYGNPASLLAWTISVSEKVRLDSAKGAGSYTVH
jgi:hypothetical protein